MAHVRALGLLGNRTRLELCLPLAPAPVREEHALPCTYLAPLDDHEHASNTLHQTTWICAPVVLGSRIGLLGHAGFEAIRSEHRIHCCLHLEITGHSCYPIDLGQARDVLVCSLPILHEGHTPKE